MTNSTDIQVKEIIDAYAESLGVEGAKKVVDQAIIDSGLPRQFTYSPADAIKICEVLKQNQGYVAIIAGFLGARFAMRKVGRLQT